MSTRRMKSILPEVRATAASRPPPCRLACRPVVPSADAADLWRIWSRPGFPLLTVAPGDPGPSLRLSMLLSPPCFVVVAFAIPSATPPELGEAPPPMPLPSDRLAHTFGEKGREEEDTRRRWQGPTALPGRRPAPIPRTAPRVSLPKSVTICVPTGDPRFARDPSSTNRSGGSSGLRRRAGPRGTSRAH